MKSKIVHWYWVLFWGSAASIYLYGAFFGQGFPYSTLFWKAVAFLIGFTILHIGLLKHNKLAWILAMTWYVISSIVMIMIPPLNYSMPGLPFDLISTSITLIATSASIMVYITLFTLLASWKQFWVKQ